MLLPICCQNKWKTNIEAEEHEPNKRRKTSSDAPKGIYGTDTEYDDAHRIFFRMLRVSVPQTHILKLCNHAVIPLFFPSAVRRSIIRKVETATCIFIWGIRVFTHMMPYTPITNYLFVFLQLLAKLYLTSTYVAIVCSHVYLWGVSRNS